MTNRNMMLNLKDKAALKKVLLIANDREAAMGVSVTLDEMSDVQVERQKTSLSQLNGTAVSMAQDHDVILFATDPTDEADMQAIRTLAQENKSGTILLALTSGEISLSAARELTRVGVHDVLPIEIGSEDLSEQIAKWTKVHAPTQIDGPSGRVAKVIPVTQARGGIGSTSVAVNLATALAKIGARRKVPGTYRVALLDLDFQFGAVASFLDIEEQDGLLDLAMNDAEPDLEFLQQCIVTLEGGLDVLAAPSRFAPIELLNNTKMELVLNLLSAEYDYIVVDMPRALVGWIGPVLSRADHLYMVTDVTVPSVRQMRRLIDIYTEDNLTLPIDLVVNQGTKPLLPSGQQKAAEKVLERSFKYWLPEDIKAARTSLDHGKPITEIAPRSKLGKAYRKLATATVSQLPTTPTINARHQ